MKRMLFILLFLPLCAIGQDIDKTDGNWNFTGKITTNEAYHLFSFFGDSTITFTYATQNVWYQVTNASDSLYRYTELDGFTVLADTIYVAKTGDYDMRAKLVLDGGNGETISFRFFNVTKGAGIPTAGATTTRSSGAFQSVTIDGYGELTAGDKIILQLKNDDVSPSNSIIKNGIIKIIYIHD